MKTKGIAWVVMIVLCLTLLALMLGCEGPTSRIHAGGELLWKGPEGVLYRCGPVFEDVCFDNGHCATKVYSGE